MAFECGALAASNGRTHQDLLQELLQHLEERFEHLTYDKVTVMESFGWCGTDVRIERKDDAPLVQYIQVSTGHLILDDYVEQARAVLGEDRVSGKDVMLKMIMKGPSDFRITHSVLEYVAERWDGILWDESAGFAVSIVE